MKKEDVMRRISAALDTEGGLVGDPALQAELRADPESAKYAKDVTRVGKWLATWPLPEPDDAAFEALAKRIEQRLGESLPTMSDPTAAPVFDDDDALRDATARLLNSGEFPLSDSSIELISDPSNPGLVAAPAPDAPAAAAPVAPPTPAAPAQLAKVALSKARAPAIVEEASSPGSGEPLSAADLELRLDGKSKKKNGPAEPGTPAGTKKKKKKGTDSLPPSGDRISIPTPKPTLDAPSLSPVVQLPKAEDRKPTGTFWWFAAAAAVGLGVFGAATLFESGAAPAAEGAQGSTLVTTGSIQPVAQAPADDREEAPAAVPVVAVPPMPPATIVAAAPVVPPDVADPTAQTEQERWTGTPTTAAHAHYATATPDPMPSAPARMRASGGGGRGDTAEVDDMLGAGLGGAPSRRAAGTGSGPTATATTAPAPTPSEEPAHAPTTGRTTPPPPPATRVAEAPADLPETPDRATIQAVLAARTEAVTSCAAGAHGLADVDIVIAASGRITTATVNGTFAGTPVGSCIARAVRGATFPPFSQARFEVTYPYHL